MGRHSRHSRHRLGRPGLVHCLEHDSVAETLAGVRRTWFAALLAPARHNLSEPRRRSPVAVVRRIWAPAPAPAPAAPATAAAA